MRSRAQPGTIGEHRDVVLGVPGETDVTVRIVSSVGGALYASSDYVATTGAVPSGMPVAQIFANDAARRSPDLQRSIRILSLSLPLPFQGGQPFGAVSRTPAVRLAPPSAQAAGARRASGPPGGPDLPAARHA